MSSADPRLVGEWLLAKRELHQGAPLSHFADSIPWDRMPTISPSRGTASETHRAYHDELEQRAAAGDRYAASMLSGQNPDDDPGGT